MSLSLVRFSNSVADAGLCDDDVRLARVYFDLLAKLTDIHAEILSICRMRRPPYGAQDLLVRYHLAGVARQKRKQVEFLGREFQFDGVTDHAMSNAVDLKVCRAQHRRLVSTFHPVPQRRPHAGQQLAHSERFVDEVVAAKVKSFDLLGFPVSR